MRNYLFLLALLLSSFATNAQIGYQVTLLDRATGEPRSCETVAVSIEITNSAGAVIYSGTQSATTNDFGILSLSVGNSSTFDNVDWSKLPLSISATVDGILIGRSQILNVPVAEYAKRSGILTTELLCSQTWSLERCEVSFSPSGRATIRGKGQSPWIETGPYYIDGNIVVIVGKGEKPISIICLYIPSLNKLVHGGSD